MLPFAYIQLVLCTLHMNAVDSSGADAESRGARARRALPHVDLQREGAAAHRSRAARDARDRHPAPAEHALRAAKLRLTRATSVITVNDLLILYSVLRWPFVSGLRKASALKHITFLLHYRILFIVWGFSFCDSDSMKFHFTQSLYSQRKIFLLNTLYSNSSKIAILYSYFVYMCFHRY